MPGAAWRATLAALLSLAAVGSAACERDAPVATLAIDCRLSPAIPIVGAESRVDLRLQADGRAVAGARLQVEAWMSHPGMAPVVGPAIETSSGAYVARLTLTMAGDWVVFVSGELADGRRVRQQAASIAARAGAAG